MVSTSFDRAVLLNQRVDRILHGHQLPALVPHRRLLQTEVVEVCDWGLHCSLRHDELLKGLAVGRWLQSTKSLLRAAVDFRIYWLVDLYFWLIRILGLGVEGDFCLVCICRTHVTAWQNTFHKLLVLVLPFNDLNGGLLLSLSLSYWLAWELDRDVQLRLFGS